MVRTIQTLRGRFVGGDTIPHGHHVYTQRFERRRIRFALRSNDDIERGALAERGKQLGATKLAESPFHSVAVDGGVLMTRHNEPNAWNAERGRVNPDIEMNGPNALPLSNDGL